MTSFRQKQLSDIVWSTTGDETLTLTSLAATSGCRAGDEHDFGTPFPIRVRIELETKFAVSPTEGNILVEWSSSKEGSDYDGECTGSDAGYTHTSRLRHVGVLVPSEDTDLQRMSWDLFLPAQHGLPVVSNEANQALSATAGDHLLTVTPILDTDDTP